MATRTLILGASGGIGSALVAEARDRGHDVTTLSRSGDGFDITSQASVETALGAFGDTFDLILVATGALEIAGYGPEKSLKALQADALADQLRLNAIGPALVLAQAPRLLPRDRPAHLGVLSARVGSIGDNRLGGWYGYRAAKAALNQYLRIAAVEIARSHKQAVLAALHPGTVATDFTAKYVSPDTATPPAEAARNLIDVLTALGPGQSGGFYDYAGKEIPW